MTFYAIIKTIAAAATGGGATHIPTAPWTKHQSPAGFSIDLPPGWSIQPNTAPLTVAANTDGSQAVIIEHLPANITGTPSEILRNGRFSATVFHQGITPQIITEGPPAASYVAAL